MPDFNIEHYYACEDTKYFSIKIGEYTITHDNYNDWHCTCLGFKYSKGKKPCKHIIEARSKKCSWNQYIDGGEPVSGKCPKCGGPIIGIKVAV